MTSKLWNTEHNPSRVTAACKKTLTDLNLDHLDLYLVHWPLAFDPAIKSMNEVLDSNGQLRLEKGISLLDTWKAMESLVDQGLCKHIGVSNFTIAHLKEILPHARIPIAVNQVSLVECKIG